MRLQRYHGLGNDYLVLADPAFPGGLEPALVRALCNRHTGVGGDGVLLPGRNHDGAVGLRIYNPDGSEAEKSGNGLRIFARFLVDHRGASRTLRIDLATEQVVAQVDEQWVTVSMGRARFEADQVPVRDRGVNPMDRAFRVLGQTLPATCVGVGNPHCVVFFQTENLDELPWRAWGAALEVHPDFPNRTNVQFVRVMGPGRVAARIWERGAGETRSSGSSSCAIAAAAVRTGRLEVGSIAVEMPGGTLEVDVAQDYTLTLRGPVQFIGTVQVAASWLAHLGAGNGRIA
jgi:diaminopimelate epimerase